MSDPILNKIHAGIQKFIEEHIIHIPDDKKEAALAHGQELLATLVEAGAKGVAEGVVDEVKNKAEGAQENA